MAKQRGPVASTFSGRVGNVVGAKLKGGEYVTRSYQPSVKNPNTLRQQVSRKKLALASEIAAAASAAVEIGFAKASSSSKMYPRNMFVKELIPVANGHFTMTANVPSVNMQNLVLSAKIGVEVRPQVTMAYSEESNVFQFTASNAAQVPLNQGERLGLIVAVINPATATAPAKAVVVMGDAANGVVLDGDIASDFLGSHVYAFYKVIPAALNGVPTTEIPWKYPSNTGATIHVGTLDA